MAINTYRKAPDMLYTSYTAIDINQEVVIDIIDCTFSTLFLTASAQFSCKSSNPSEARSGTGTR